MNRSAPLVAPAGVTGRSVLDSASDILSQGRVLEPFGHWLVRLVVGGPSVPARAGLIRMQEHAAAPVDPWPNAEARPIGIWADVAGVECDYDELLVRRKTPITSAEYDRQMAEMKANMSAGVYDPRNSPRRPIDISRLPPPKFHRGELLI